LVEDDSGDVALIEESFAAIGSHVSMEVVSAGDEALAHLHGQAACENQPRPGF
jgi:hypothetical protein